ncbi:hypothetical protein RHMOL_Rhmol11G0184600 [Rhododendron molle]|uniref:Uncharacterized protein n=2 Tax=Rhododendron molle TaxID=49168 RepID=A0ACC0LUL2_RHOML|nr:hypothetical protein RHMOL_Rhmol11G0184600 [Rhododendron molle]KAI8532067.1 hypothetical protein RHMOL_Rhmol11G0184600 [Rhododendron molle]
MASEASQTMSLKILVEKEKNRIVFVEANKDFADVLFSFLTIPIGTIFGLTREHFLEGEIGCLNDLYESLEKLDEDFLSSEQKGILLHPRCATDIYCRNLKVNLAECNESKYYVCKDAIERCDFVSYYQNYSCPCGKALQYEVNLLNPVPHGGSGFIKPAVRFMITDDFQVLPMSTMAGLSLLGNFGAFDGSKTEERMLNVGKDEVLKLLKCSLASRTPFSDSILEPPFSKTKPMINYGQCGPRMINLSQRDADTRNKDEKINLKLIINRSNNRVLYAEVEENFVYLLCSFLSIPIGYVIKEFPYLSFKGNLENLRKSVQDLDVSKFFKSEEMKAILLDPKLAPGTSYDKKLIGIEEAVNLPFSTLYSLFEFESSDLSSESPLREVKIGGALVKGPSMFMVTDSLSIAPLSPISGISLINRLKVPLSDIKELEVNMGEEETLRLLVALLVSRSALTDAFVLKETKQET